MKFSYALAVVLMILSCKDKTKTTLSVQEIVDRSIEISGGERYKTSDISFKFRDMRYASEWKGGGRILKRSKKTDSMEMVDIRTNQDFTRLVDDRVVSLNDSLANLYANSVNSVHYFANLPYGLNDPAVNKELLGVTTIKDRKFYKVKISFDQKGGGDDYDDIYLYWFDKETFKPTYLAYQFHVNGGGIRFRAAYNERYIGGIRFVDYENYEASADRTSIYDVDSLYGLNRLNLLSKIELEHINVSASH